MAISWSPIMRGSSSRSNGLVLIATGGSSGRYTFFHTSPSCWLQSMKTVFIASTCFLHRASHLADAVHLLEPLRCVAGKLVEGVGDLVVLNFRQSFADLSQRNGAAEIEPVNGCDDANDGEQDEQFPNLGVDHAIQETH